MSSASELNLVVSHDESAIEIGGQNLRLPLLEGWDLLEDRQQRYLAEYAKSPENKTLSAMNLGYKVSEVNRWFSQENFSLVANQIYDVYTELLKSKDFEDSVENSKIRARVIKARESGGSYTEKKEGSKHLHLHSKNESLQDFLKMLGD